MRLLFLTPFLIALVSPKPLVLEPLDDTTLSFLNTTAASTITDPNDATFTDIITQGITDTLTSLHRYASDLRTQYAEVTIPVAYSAQPDLHTYRFAHFRLSLIEKPPSPSTPHPSGTYYTFVTEGVPWNEPVALRWQKQPRPSSFDFAAVGGRLGLLRAWRAVIVEMAGRRRGFGRFNMWQATLMVRREGEEGTGKGDGEVGNGDGGVIEQRADLENGSEGNVKYVFKLWDDKNPTRTGRRFFKLVATVEVATEKVRIEISNP